ncbi:MAG TPA: hypothetical protein VN634_09835 [Candidatus Limnocylindrales bacterium]|nr:hypothetical protein [Candidatus Limnocylindrales bacterium]
MNVSTSLPPVPSSQTLSTWTSALLQPVLRRAVARKFARRVAATPATHLAMTFRRRVSTARSTDRFPMSFAKRFPTVHAAH